MNRSNTAASLSHESLAALRRRRTILDEVREGLARPQKELPPKFFYDARGSQLFEEITRLPEYYLTRAEREILIANARDLAATTRAHTLVELGAGSAAKTRVLIEALRCGSRAVTYVPIDVSGEFLDDTVAALRDEYPDLDVAPVVADIAVELELPSRRPGPVLFALLGSTVGNFERCAAIALLRRVRAAMGPNDRFLLGADLRKSREVLEAAYDDARGVTADFNLNMLRVLNAELDADFAPSRFRHRAVYDEVEHRIEMHLDSIGAQEVHIPGLPTIALRAGESIRTEISCKYDRDAVDAMGAAAGLEVTRWLTDGDARFALALFRPAQ